MIEFLRFVMRGGSWGNWPTAARAPTRACLQAPYGNVINGLAIDSWMCAISGRAKQFGMIEYFKDCQ